MNCDETFNAGICYVTDAYKKVCRFNEELHADLEKCRSENAKLRELVLELYEYRQLYFKTGIYPTDHGVTERRMRELGVEA